MKKVVILIVVLLVSISIVYTCEMVALKGLNDRNLASTGPNSLYTYILVYFI